jgi:hypothetical protein
MMAEYIVLSRLTPEGRTTIKHKHLLTALELHMECIGQPIKFKKPKPTKDLRNT